MEERIQPRLPKIKIKFNSSSAAGSSGREGSRNSKGAPTGINTSRANKHRKLLEGYPGPSSSVFDIVAALSSGWQDLHQCLRPWDDELAIPPELLSFAAEGDFHQPSKRSRCSLTESVGILPTVAQKHTAQRLEEIAPIKTVGGKQNTEQEPPQAISERKAAVGAASELGLSLAIQDNNVLKESEHQTVHLPGSSSSEQATLSTYHHSSSPEGGDLADAPVRLDSSSRLNSASVQVQAACSLDGTGEYSHAEVRNNNSCGCQAGSGIVLPPNCLNPQGRHSEATVSLQSISPFEMHMTTFRPKGRMDQIDDAMIQGLISKATERKRAVDKHGKSPPRTVAGYCKYLECGTMFMEACEYMLKGPRPQDCSSRLASLYSSTAAFFLHIAKVVPTAEGPDLSKEALRILAEKLGVVCCMREAVHSQARLAEDVKRAQSISHKISQSILQQQPAPSREPPGSRQKVPPVDRTRGEGQPSPDDSTNSSLNAMAASSAPQSAPIQAMLSGESMKRLLDQARKAASCSDLIRRSTISFQTFIERPDCRNIHDAKLASMHMAAVSMDMGMVDGFRVLEHATKALSHIMAISLSS